MKKGIRILARDRTPARLWPGDRIILSYREPGAPERVVVDKTVDRQYYFEEGVVFEADAGIFGKGAALGGAFIEKPE